MRSDLGEKIIRGKRDFSADGIRAAASGEKVEENAEYRKCGDHGEPQQCPLRFVALIPQNIRRAEQNCQRNESEPDDICQYNDSVNVHRFPLVFCNITPEVRRVK